jgi:hypothetical protein
MNLYSLSLQGNSCSSTNTKESTTFHVYPLSITPPVLHSVSLSSLHNLSGVNLQHFKVVSKETLPFRHVLCFPACPAHEIRILHHRRVRAVAGTKKTKNKMCHNPQHCSALFMRPNITGWSQGPLICNLCHTSA